MTSSSQYRAPLPEKWRPPIVSDAHCPMRSTDSVELTEMKSGSPAIRRGSLT